MENFTFYSPTFFAFGRDSESQAGDLIKDLGEARSSFILAETVQNVQDSWTGLNLP